MVDGIEVYSTKISCKVTSRFAHNVVTTRAVNRADTAKEVSFDVELPKTAFITNFTLTIDGVTYPGNIKEKEVAKKQYEKAVSQGKTAGLVKASGRKLEKFTVSVNVAAGSKVTFELTYEELLKRHKGKYEMYIKVQPKQLVRHFEVISHPFIPAWNHREPREGQCTGGDERRGVNLRAETRMHLQVLVPVLGQWV